MNYSSSCYDNKPFEDHEKVLKKLIKKREKKKAEKIFKEKRKINEADLFKTAMLDVTPLGGSRKIAKNPPEFIKFDYSENEDENIKKNLADLVEYGAGFDVSKTPEYNEHTGAGVSKEIAHLLHIGKFSVREFIDLHGLCLSEAEEKVRLFLKESFELRKNAVLIVHGRGLSSQNEPVLKNKVIEILSSNYWRRRIYAYTSAKRTDGGAGGTYILFRNKPLTGKQEKNIYRKKAENK